ncbi:hypothetical protein KI387_008283, partial [Taxus chinensis]
GVLNWCWRGDAVLTGGVDGGSDLEQSPGREARKFEIQNSKNINDTLVGAVGRSLPSSPPLDYGLVDVDRGRLE